MLNQPLNLILVHALDVLTDSYQQPLTGLINAKTQAIHSAADALRLILNKLPIDKPESTEYSLHSTADYVPQEPPGASDNNHIDQDHHNQYAIPSDPPPPFRPLSHKYLPATYGPPGKAPAISSITHTQIITTAYGAPISNFQKPVSLLDVDTSSTGDKWPDTPIGPGVSQPGIDSAPLDMYHVLSLRNKELHSSSANSHESLVDTNEIPHAPSLSQELPHYSPPSGQYGPPNHPPPPSSMHQIVHQQGGHGSHAHEFAVNSLGPGYEIHKSIGYEFRGQPHMQYVHRRNGVKVRRSSVNGRIPPSGNRPAGRHWTNTDGSTRLIKSAFCWRRSLDAPDARWPHKRINTSAGIFVWTICKLF